MRPDIDKLNSVFGSLKRFREAFNLGDFFIQPHVMHITMPFKGLRPNLDKRFHTHRTYELSMTLSGKMKYIFQDKEIDLKSGDAVIIPAGKPHSWLALEDSLIFNIMLFISRHGDGAREDMGKFKKALADHNFLLKDFREFERIIEKIIDEADKRKIVFDDKISYLSREISIELFRRLLDKMPLSSQTMHMPPKRGNTSTSIVELIRYYVQDNLSRPIRMREISAHLGISVNHMNRIYKSESGETIQSYISFRKIEQSSDLLNTTNRSVKDIASLVGFDDVNYFCRTFKKYTGITTTQFRQGITPDPNSILAKKQAEKIEIVKN